MPQQHVINEKGNGTATYGVELHVLRCAMAPGMSGQLELTVRVKKDGQQGVIVQTGNAVCSPGNVNAAGVGCVASWTMTSESFTSTPGFNLDVEMIFEGHPDNILRCYVNAPTGTVVEARLNGILNG
jgi:hypothetical protein